MGEWTDSDDSDDCQPQKKWLKTSTGESSSKPTTEEELALKLKGVIPKNTQKNDRWASTTFMEWMKQRNKCSLESCPKTILETEDAHV